MIKPSTTHLCLCGCGDNTLSPKANFISGHDARMVSKVVAKILDGGDSSKLLATLPSEALIAKAKSQLERQLFEKNDRDERAKMKADRKAAKAPKAAKQTVVKHENVKPESDTEDEPIGSNTLHNPSPSKHASAPSSKSSKKTRRKAA